MRSGGTLLCATVIAAGIIQPHQHSALPRVRRFLVYVSTGLDRSHQNMRAYICPYVGLCTPAWPSTAWCSNAQQPCHRCDAMMRQTVFNLTTDPPSQISAFDIAYHSQRARVMFNESSFRWAAGRVIGSLRTLQRTRPGTLQGIL